MYGVLLMAAMTTGGTAPDCWNCRSAASYGCAGGGSGHGHGYAVSGYSPYGCMGYSGGASMGFGCYGGSYNANWIGVGGNYECWGGHGCYGCVGYLGCGGGAGVNPNPEQIPPPRVDTTTGKATTDRARLTVQVPADAKLYIDDQLMKSASERRTFNTPKLGRGQAYYYEVRAELVRDGEMVTETKKVIVRAGDEQKVSFGKIEAADLASRQTVPPRDVTADATRRERE